MRISQIALKQHCVLLNKGGAPASLFVIPGVGGRTEMFKCLAEFLAGTFTVYGLNMLGTETGEAPLRDIAAVASQNIGWLKAADPGGRYHLLGHSFGAYIAFEMAKQIETADGRTAPIFILDQEAPLERCLGPRADAVGFALQLAKGYYPDFRVIKEWPDYMSDELLPCLLEKDPAEFAAVIHEYVLGQLGVKRRLVEVASRLIHLRVLNALMAYEPSGKLRSPMVIYKAEGEERINPDRNLGWGGLSENLSVRSIPGNHISMCSGENAVILAEEIVEAAGSYL